MVRQKAEAAAVTSRRWRFHKQHKIQIPIPPIHPHHHSQDQKGVDFCKAIFEFFFGFINFRDMLCRKNSVKIVSGSAPVYLNVYDLTSINGYAYWLGLGAYHSGVQGQSSIFTSSQFFFFLNFCFLIMWKQYQTRSIDEDPVQICSFWVFAAALSTPFVSEILSICS